MIKCNYLKDPMKFGAIVLRLAFGILFILAAVQKFRMGYGAFADIIMNGDNLIAKEIPAFLLTIYGYALPGLEFIVGILLVLNIWSKYAYATISLIYLSFIFGQTYNGNASIVGTEYIPALLTVVVAYYLQDKAVSKK